MKEKIGRKRYIIAENKDNLQDIVAKFNGVVVYKSDRFAVIFCKHYKKEQAVKILNENRIRTYKTVGSIKKAKKIIAELSLHFN